MYEKWYGHSHTDAGRLGTAVYGLPELWAERILNQKLIANPGCYTSASILGLAPFLVQQIFQIIRDINAQGVTILLVEQNAFQALRVANRGYVLETGRVVLEDRADKLLENDEVRKAYLGE